MMSDDPDEVVEHRPPRCSCCGGSLQSDLPIRRLFARPIWLRGVFALAKHVTDLAAATLAAERRSPDRQLSATLTTLSRCELTRELQARIGRAREQLMVFLAHPGVVDVTNNGCEGALRPAVVQRKLTNGYRAMRAPNGEAAIRTVVDTARLTSAGSFGTVLITVSA
jgi:transposase